MKQIEIRIDIPEEMLEWIDSKALAILSSVKIGISFSPSRSSEGFGWNLPFSVLPCSGQQIVGQYVIPIAPYTAEPKKEKKP